MMHSLPRLLWASAPVAFCVLLAATARADFSVEQLTTDPSGAVCGSYLPDESSSGDDIAFESDCDLDGDNADLSFEIYRVHRGQTPKQVSDATGCTSSSASISASGSRIAFESDCNQLGTNNDGNVEIFFWKNGVITQLTTSSACDNLAPSINAAGTLIAFDSNCIYPASNNGKTNNDASTEIFQVTDTGALSQLTQDDSGACDSINASSNAAGSLVAFESDCDLKGTNEDFASEIFTVTPSGTVKQVTSASPDDSCSSMTPSIDDAGAKIAFESDCDFSGANADRGQEAFVADASGATISQVSDDDGPSLCSSSRPRMSGNGSLVTFSSYCNLAGSNADASLEVFQATVGQTPIQLTSGASCSSLVGDTSVNGRDVALDSDCNPLGTNADGGTEIFRLNACVCGAPATRKIPPKTSDALIILKGAVGQVVCLPCECDTDSNGEVVSSDALRVLKAAVGLPIPLLCPAP